MTNAFTRSAASRMIQRRRRPTRQRKHGPYEALRHTNQQHEPETGMTENHADLAVQDIMLDADPGYQVAVDRPHEERLKLTIIK